MFLQNNQVNVQIPDLSVPLLETIRRQTNIPVLLKKLQTGLQPTTVLGKKKDNFLSGCSSHIAPPNLIIKPHSSQKKYIPPEK
jgi:hypothetical protein